MVYYISCGVLYIMWYTIYHVVYYISCGVLYIMWCTIYHVVYYISCGVLYIMWCTIYHVVYYISCGVLYIMWYTIYHVHVVYYRRYGGRAGDSGRGGGPRAHGTWPARRPGDAGRGPLVQNWSLTAKRHGRLDGRVDIPAVPQPGNAAEQRRQPAFQRRAADDGHRLRPDGEPAHPAHGRADGGPGAGHRRGSGANSGGAARRGWRRHGAGRAEQRDHPELRQADCRA